MADEEHRRRKTPVHLLPDETLPRIKLLLENSAPNPDRPRLSAESEAALAAVEGKSAETYAEAEETTHRILKLAQQIRAETEMEDGAVKDVVDDDEQTKKEPT